VAALLPLLHGNVRAKREADVDALLQVHVVPGFRVAASHMLQEWRLPLTTADAVCCVQLNLKPLGRAVLQHCPWERHWSVDEHPGRSPRAHGLLTLLHSIISYNTAANRAGELRIEKRIDAAPVKDVLTLGQLPHDIFASETPPAEWAPGMQTYTPSQTPTLNECKKQVKYIEGSLILRWGRLILIYVNVVAGAFAEAQ
jgi:hypothetical protein